MRCLNKTLVLIRHFGLRYCYWVIKLINLYKEKHRGWKTSLKSAIREEHTDRYSFEFDVEALPKSGAFFTREIINPSERAVICKFDLTIDEITGGNKWLSVDVGYMVDGKFYFITFKHERFGTKIPTTIDPSSIPFLIKNRFQRIDFKNVILRVRVNLKGNGRVVVRLENLQSLNMPADYSLGDINSLYKYEESLLAFKDKPEELNELMSLVSPRYNDFSDCCNILDSYWNKHNTIEINAAKLYKSNGELCYSKLPPIQSDCSLLPLSVQKFPNYERRWHSLEIVHILIAEWRSQRDFGSLLSALGHTERWLAQYFFTPQSNIKYIWYDHGTADRMIVLSELFLCLHHEKADNVTLTKLFYVIYRHAQALGCESFYLRNQKVPYHNHAIFQDRALIILSQVFDKLECFIEWGRLSIKRCMLQFENLISEEGISVENSTGYHFAMQEIVLNTQRTLEGMVSYSHYTEMLQGLVCKMAKASSSFNYPDRTSPAIGDTVYKTNQSRKKYKANFDLVVGGKPQVEYYPDSGFVFVGGVTTEGKEFKFVFTCSSKSKIHKHFDSLSFTLWLDGVEYFSDPGFYSHGTDAHSIHSKGPYAHNIPIPDIELMQGDWRQYLCSAHVSMFVSKTNPSLISIKGIHRLSTGHDISRDVILDLERSTFIFKDNVLQEDKLLTSFQLGDGVLLKKVKSNLTHISHPNSDLGIGLEYCPENKVDFYIGEETRFVAGWVYPKVGKKIPAPAIKMASKSNVNYFSITIANCFEKKSLCCQKAYEEIISTNEWQKYGVSNDIIR